MTGFEKFKLALKQADEKRHEELARDIAKVKQVVNKILTLALDNTANIARTRYSGLEMF